VYWACCNKEVIVTCRLGLTQHLILRTQLSYCHCVSCKHSTYFGPLQKAGLVVSVSQPVTAIDRVLFAGLRLHHTGINRQETDNKDVEVSLCTVC